LRKFLLLVLRIAAIVVVSLILLVALSAAGYWVYWHSPSGIENLDERLPLVFHFERLWIVWAWIACLLACAIGSGYWTVRAIRAARTATAHLESGAGIGRTPELDNTWSEIEARLGRGFTERLYLTLTPSEDDASALLDASELHVESRVPQAPALLQASLTARGTFLACVARPVPGEADSGVAPSRVEYVSQRLRALDSGQYGLRGVIVIFPVDWLNRPDASRLATSYRDDLQSIARILECHYPAYAVVTGMESVPGFLAFVGSMQESFRAKRRCGFSIPGDATATASLVHGGLVWFSGWYETWMLHLMAKEPLDHARNNALFTLDSQIRHFRRRLPELLGAAFATPHGGELRPLHGCYFAATGPSPDTSACAVGFIRGRVLDDPAASRWTQRAIEHDRAYRRMAWTVGLVGASAALLVWAYIGLGLRSLHWVDVATPAALVSVWIVALLRLR
jgi:hypothetical protein